MSDRCDLTELIVTECGCRHHRGGRTPEEEARATRAARRGDGEPGRWFSSIYAGKCSRCGFGFVAGDRIRADGAGGWECCEGTDS